MLPSAPMIIRTDRGLVSALDAADGVLLVAVEEGVAKGGQLTYENAANLAHFLIRLYNLQRKDPAFHGETSKDGLREVIQLPLSVEEVKYITNVIAFRRSFIARNPDEVIFTNRVCQGATLETDNDKFDGLANKLNNIALKVFPEDCL